MAGDSGKEPQVNPQDPVGLLPPSQGCYGLSYVNKSSRISGKEFR